MVKLTVADLVKTGNLLKKNRFISDFKIVDNWLIVWGTGHKEQQEATDVITLLLGFEPNSPNAWWQRDQHRRLGFIVKVKLDFEICVKIYRP